MKKDVFLKSSEFLRDRDGNLLCRYLSSLKVEIGYTSCETNLPFVCASGKLVANHDFNNTRSGYLRESIPWRMHIEFKLNLIQKQLSDLNKKLNSHDLESGVKGEHLGEDQKNHNLQSLVKMIGSCSGRWINWICDFVVQIDFVSKLRRK